MKAVILAAGTASRLRPLTATRPKCLLPVGGRTLLQRSIDSLITCGVRDIVIVTGYLHGMIEDFICDHYSLATSGQALRFEFIHNERYATTNNMYSLWLACPVLRGDTVLLLDSDMLYSRDILRSVVDAPAKNVLTVVRHDLGEEEMKVVTDLAGNIVKITKQCSPQDAIGESLGIEKMSPSYFDALSREMESIIVEDGKMNEFYEKAFERLICRGVTFTMLDVSSHTACEIDTVDDYHRVNLIPNVDQMI